MDSLVEKRIELFDQARDVRFFLPYSPENAQNYCFPKHQRLKECLEKLGYFVEYGLCRFKWSEQIVSKRVLSIEHEDVEPHFYLRVLIGGEYKDVDCTFERGFPKSNTWDGITSTPISVNYFEMVPVEFIKEETAKFLENVKKKIEKNGNFYKAVNDLFDRIRKIRTGEGLTSRILNEAVKLGERSNLGRSLLGKIADCIN